MNSKLVPTCYLKFAVLDRPLCVWSPRLEEENLRFLRGVDPKFFLYQAQLHDRAELPTDATARRETESRAALTLRLNYGMALESLFAMLGAVVQAPECVFAWLSSYRNHELLELVKRINDGTSLRVRPDFRPATWEALAATFTEPAARTSQEEFARARTLFASAWRLFAEDFLSPLRSAEYNSLKHGFRVEPAGLTLKFEHEGETLFESHSPLAHSFLLHSRFEGRQHHLTAQRVTMALEPTRYNAGLRLIALSLSNLVAYARARAGDDRDDVRFTLPPDDSLLQAMHANLAPVQSFAYGEKVIPDAAEFCSEAEILAAYDDDAS